MEEQFFPWEGVMMAVVVLGATLEQWAKLRVSISEDLVLAAMREINSPENRYFFWLKYGESNPSPDQLAVYYCSTGAFERLIQHKCYVNVTQHR